MFFLLGLFSSIIIASILYLYLRWDYMRQDDWAVTFKVWFGRNDDDFVLQILVINLYVYLIIYFIFSDVQHDAYLEGIKYQLGVLILILIVGGIYYDIIRPIINVFMKIISKIFK